MILVLRVAESPHFREGLKSRALLLYVCEQALLGQSDNLTTQLIACRVFGRPPEFNAALACREATVVWEL